MIFRASEDCCQLCGDPLARGQEHAHPECVQAWHNGDEQPPDHHTDGRPIHTAPDPHRRLT